MARMARFCRVVLVSWLLLAATSCLAEGASTPHGGPRWTCWYVPGAETIQCLLIPATEGGYMVDAAVAERARQLHLPDVVRAIWSDPEQISGYRVSIPMWAPPEDMNFARQLAESVMCGARTDCSVIYDANHDGRGPLRAAALEAGVPENEVMQELATQGIALAPVASEAADEPPRRTRTRRRFFSDGVS